MKIYDANLSPTNTVHPESIFGHQNRKAVALAVVLLTLFILSFVLTLLFFVTRDTRIEMIQKREKLRSELLARGLVQIALLKIKMLPQEFYNAYHLSTFNPVAPDDYPCVVDGVYFPYTAMEGIDFPSGLRSMPQIKSYLDSRSLNFGPVAYDCPPGAFLGKRLLENDDPKAQVWKNNGYAGGVFIEQLRVLLNPGSQSENDLPVHGPWSGELADHMNGRITWSPFGGEAFVSSLRLLTQVQENLRDAIEIEVYATVDTGIDQRSVGLRRGKANHVGETMRESIFHREIIDLRWRPR